MAAVYVGTVLSSSNSGSYRKLVFVVSTEERWQINRLVRHCISNAISVEVKRSINSVSTQSITTCGRIYHICGDYNKKDKLFFLLDMIHIKLKRAVLVNKYIEFIINQLKKKFSGKEYFIFRSWLNFKLLSTILQRFL